jgi:transcriptional regulator with XRE-family HTH domain
MARFNAWLRSLMTEISSTTLLQSQAWLACGAKAKLYDAEMSMGTRIRAARKREKKGQRAVAEHLGVTVQAVSGWERDVDQPTREHLFKLALFLKSPVMWLNGADHDIEDIRMKLEALTPDDRASVAALIDILLAKRGRAA